MRVMATAKIRIFVLDEARCSAEPRPNTNPNFSLTAGQRHCNRQPTLNPSPKPQTPQADEMLALGSLGDQSKRIRQKLPKNVQTLFFSATWTETVTPLTTQPHPD